MDCDIIIKSTGFSKEEVRQATRIQIDELDQGFLSSFGENALEVIFTHAVESQWGVMVMAIDRLESRVVGYVLGSTDTSGLYKEFLLKRTPCAMIHFLPKMLSLERLRKATETLLYPARFDIGRSTPKAELLDLAVNHAYHGTGAAQALFREFVKEQKRLGVAAFRIPTSASLSRAHRFYEKLGAVRAGSMEVHRGEEVLLYIFSIDE